MSEVTSLTARRWDKGDGSPNSYPAREALEVALHRLDSGEWPADHIVVIFGHVTETGAADTYFTQAGKFDAFGQKGLLAAAQRVMTREA